MNAKTNSLKKTLNNWLVTTAWWQWIKNKPWFLAWWYWSKKHKKQLRIALLIELVILAILSMILYEALQSKKPRLSVLLTLV